MSAKPLVSIVMPCLNHERFIGDAIDSILTQDYERVELVIADGGSTDASLDILADRAERYPNVHWRSESDSGPANAINKAFARSRGTLIGWLNSDDLYAPAALSQAVNAFAANPSAMMIYGHGEHVDVNGTRLGRYPTQTPDVGIRAFSQGCFLCQPTAFFQRSMLTLLGPLDESLSAAFDFDYWLRAFSAFPERIGFVDAVLAQSRLHDECITMRSRRKVALEGMRVTAAHLGRAHIHWLTTYFEEVSKLSIEERGFDDFATHAIETADLASSYLAPEDVTAVKARFQNG